ncbi:MAG: heavy metal translocating P-type ATPase [Streptosporangiaceae bacterium]
MEPSAGQATVLTPAPPAGPGTPGRRRFTLLIEGMTCASCAARIEKRLNRIDHVTATVNYATHRAQVIASAGVSAQTLVAAVGHAGYSAEPAGGETDGEDRDRRQLRSLKHRLTVALVFFVPLCDLSITLSLVPAYRFAGWQWTLVGLTAPVAVWAAWPIHRAAVKNARHGTCSMDTLVSLGITAACGWSVYAMFALDQAPGGTALDRLIHGSGGGIYLEVAAAVTTFLLAGRFFEARGRRSAGEAMRTLAAAGRKSACVLGTDGTQRQVPVAGLWPGALLVVRPGERIAADGEVVFGESAVDRSMVTGESLPADLTAGEEVLDGTVVLTGRLVVRAVKVGPDTQFAHLISLVEQAQASKAAIQRLADRIAGVFVPVVLVLALATLTGWLLASSPLEHAFSAALAVLIIACPCALGLATPAALAVACGRGAQLGIFIKGFQAIESCRSIDTVVLDKTGTVTTGQMTLTGLRTGDSTEPGDLLRYAGSVEQASEHAVAAAITAAARVRHPWLPQAESFQSLPGLGARGLVDGTEVIVGRARLLREQGLAIPAKLSDQCATWERDGRTTVLVGWDGEVRGALAVGDSIRPSAPRAVAELRRLGLRPVLLTGDNEATARAVGVAVGIDEVIAGTLPDGKSAIISGLRAAGRRVAMVGDGVNDAPALAAAHLGVAVGTGTDVAICAADLILLRDDLGVVADAITLARGTFRTIRRNLAWACGYNVAAIPLAALGFLDPLVASAAMTLSSVFVVWSSLRLRRLRVCARDLDHPGTEVPPWST